MKGFPGFLRTTLAGGVIFLLPIVVMTVIIGKAVQFSQKIVAPLAAHIPMESIIGLQTPMILAIALLIFSCFLAGVLARTAPAQKGIQWLELTVLSNLPGYDFLKSIGQSLLVPEIESGHSVVLARIEDAWQLAFLTERLGHGHVAIFVPGSPNPHSGSVYFISEDRIKILNITPNAALKCLKRTGIGAMDLLKNYLESA